VKDGTLAPGARCDLNLGCTEIDFLDSSGALVCLDGEHKCEEEVNNHSTDEITDSSNDNSHESGPGNMDLTITVDDDSESSTLQNVHVSGSDHGHASGSGNSHASGSGNGHKHGAKSEAPQIPPGTYSDSCQGCTVVDSNLKCRACDNGITGTPSDSLVNLYASNCDLSLGCTLVGNVAGALVCEDGTHHCADEVSDSVLYEEKLAQKEAKNDEDADSEPNAMQEYAAAQAALQDAEEAQAREEGEQNEAEVGSYGSDAPKTGAMEGKVSAGALVPDHAIAAFNATQRDRAKADEKQRKSKTFGIETDYLIYGGIGLAGLNIACCILCCYLVAMRKDNSATTTAPGIGDQSFSKTPNSQPAMAGSDGGYMLSPKL
jgi:hypothetical protein